jgi:hypothetical protein
MERSNQMQQIFYQNQSPLRDAYEPVANHNNSTLSYQKAHTQYDKRNSTSGMLGNGTGHQGQLSHVNLLLNAS